MANPFLPTIFALLVGLTYYWSNRLNIRHKKYYLKIISFSAGVSITYLLLELFPLFTEAAANISKFLYITVLVGFIIHHIIEKEIYLHNSRIEVTRLLTLADNIFSFIYHIVLGVVLVNLYKEDLLRGLLFFIPILTYTLVSTLPSKTHKSARKAVFLSSSTLVGVLIATFIWTKRIMWLESALIGLVVGVLLYTIIRHHIPLGKKGKIGYFTLGFFLYSLLIISSWFL